MTEHPMPSSRRNSEIDSLRCFAMLAVVAMHSALLPFGWIGVWLFYVISGFVVTASLSRGDDDRPINWLSVFYARRCARIVPIYALYVVVGGVVVWLLSGAPKWEPLASLMFFYNNFAMIFGFGEMRPWPVGHLWTISVEMQFYAVYGLLFVFLSKRILSRVLLAFVVLSPVARALAGHFAPSVLGSDLAAAYAIYATSFLHFDAFGAGALLALNWSTIQSTKGAPARLFLIGTCAMAVYLAAYLAMNFLVLDRQGIDIAKDVVSGILYGQGREIWMYSALTLFNCGLLAWTASGTAPWRSITRIRAFQWIGEISYGAYIFHALAITVTQAGIRLVIGDAANPWFRVVIFVLASVLAITAAAASSRYIEKPCVRWMSRQIARRRKPEIA